MWGGGMRQAGIVAAGALHGLRHHRARLTVDHENARTFARCLTESPAREGLLSVDVAHVETNIVNVDLPGPWAESLSVRCAARGVGISVTSATRLRAVTHLDVSADDCTRAAVVLSEEAVAERAART
jgi:threonine aldolase